MRQAILACSVALLGCGRLDFGAARDGGGGTGDGALGDGALGDGGFAHDLTGFWVSTSVRLAGETSTRQRSDLVNGIRADYTVTGGAQVVSHYRIAPLADSLATVIYSGSATVTADPDGTLVLDDGMGNVDVVATQWADADDVTLTGIADPRTTGASSVFDVLSITRSTPLDSGLVGNWNIVSEDLPVGLVPENACVVATDGMSSFKFTNGTGTVLPTLLGNVTQTLHDFTTTTCGGPTTSTVEAYSAYVEAQGGSFSVWTIASNPEESTSFSGTYAFGNGGFELDVTDCVPSATCANEPTALVFGP